MSTSANIRHLRATKGMTQEQLAMLVGVSRQAIAKWEAGGTYPETEKLIRLSQIFECSLDDIVTGDLTSRPIEAAAPAPGAPQDSCGYDQAMRSFALRLACGVAIILLAIGVGLLLEGFAGPIVAEGVICLAFVLAGVAAGVAVIVPACIRRQAFNREHPFVEDFYTADDRASAGKLLGWGIGGGVALILAGVLLCELLESWKNFVGAGTLLVCIGLGVWLLIYAAVMHGRINVEEYNLEIAESMSYQAIDEVIDPVLREQMRLHKRRNALSGTLCSICILVATIVGLILLFSDNEYFWLSWAIGGISCGIVAAVVELAVKE